jgi:hypothetical protein
VGAEPLSELRAGDDLPAGPQGTFGWLARQLEQGGAASAEDAARLRVRDTVVITSSPAGLYPVAPGDRVTVCRVVPVFYWNPYAKGSGEYSMGTRGSYRNLRKTLFNVVFGLRQVSFEGAAVGCSVAAAVRLGVNPIVTSGK